MPVLDHVGSLDDLAWCRETTFGSGIAKAIIWRIATDNLQLYTELNYEELAGEHEFAIEDVRAAVAHLVTKGFARIAHGFEMARGEVLILLSPGRMAADATQRALDDERAAKQAAKIALRGGQLTRKAIPDHVKAAVFARDKHRCRRCNTIGDLTLDHIHPWSLGGPDTVDNLQVLCRPCNSSKGDRT